MESSPLSSRLAKVRSSRGSFPCFCVILKANFFQRFRASGNNMSKFVGNPAKLMNILDVFPLFSFPIPFGMTFTSMIMTNTIFEWRIWKEVPTSKSIFTYLDLYIYIYQIMSMSSQSFSTTGQLRCNQQNHTLQKDGTNNNKQIYT